MFRSRQVTKAVAQRQQWEAEQREAEQRRNQSGVAGRLTEQLKYGGDRGFIEGSGGAER